MDSEPYSSRLEDRSQMSLLTFRFSIFLGTISRCSGALSMFSIENNSGEQSTRNLKIVDYIDYVNEPTRKKAIGII